MTREPRQPNLKAPRFRKTIKSLLNEDFCKRFINKHPQYKHLPFSTLKSVIIRYNTKLWEEAINLRDGVELPEELGHIFIGTCMPAIKENIDYVATTKYNKIIKHRNFESDNYIAKIFYTNYGNKYRLSDKELWEFKGIRNFTRTVAKEYPANWKKYIQVENYMVINKVIKQLQYREYYSKKNISDTIDYNEFDLD
jgi:hypothetical protein